MNTDFRHNRYLQVLTLVLVVVAVQVATMLSGTAYYLTQLTMTAYYAMLVLGLCLLMGYAGQISLGHAGFFAIGGYTSAFMTTYNLAGLKAEGSISLLYGLGVLVHSKGLYGEEMLVFHPWVACLTALLLTACVAYLLGGPVLKLRGHYLAMATMGFSIIVYTLAVGSQALGAADGITNVPPFNVLPGLSVSGDFGARTSNYYIAWGLVALVMLGILNLIDSRVGRALRSIHGAEDAANASGVDTSGYKLQVFVLSAVLAALAGVLLTHYNNGIGPSEAGIMKSVRYVAIVAVGGMANLWGALCMSVLLNFLSLRGYFGSFDDAVFGSILIAIMLFAPRGLIRRGVLADLKAHIFQRGAEPEETEEG